MVFIHCLNCTYQTNINNPLSDYYFFSLFWNVILDFHNVWLVVNFIHKSDDHYWTVLSVSDGWDVLETFLFKHFSHYFKGVFLFWLVLLLCHEMSKLNILCFVLKIVNSCLIFRINVSIKDWFFNDIFSDVFNLNLNLTVKI